MRLFILLLVVVYSVPALCEDRLTMTDNSSSTSIKDVVRNTVRAFDSEDLDSYEACFRESRRSFMRRKAAMAFADDDCSMSLIDVHVIEEGDDSASAAVKYRFGGSSCSFLILSEVKFVKEEGSWRIDREIVRSKSNAGSSQSHYAAAPARKGEWDPMNPDPNRIPKNIHHLMGDIGIQEGMGCAGGRCLNGRCEK